MEAAGRKIKRTETYNCRYLPCFLGDDCGHSVVETRNYTKHLVQEHKFGVCKPLVLLHPRLSISYKLKGGILSYKPVIWKLHDEEFIPIGKYVNGQFSFGVVWIGGSKPELSVKMKVKKPRASFKGFMEDKKDAILLEVPISQLNVSKQGFLHVSDYVFITEDTLEKCSRKKSLKAEDGVEEWEWILSAKI